MAEGFAVALDRIYNTAKEVDEKTMALQYLDVLKAVGTSPSTKYIFPLETLKFLEPLAQMVGQAVQPK